MTPVLGLLFQTNTRARVKSIPGAGGGVFPGTDPAVDVLGSRLPGLVWFSVTAAPPRGSGRPQAGPGISVPGAHGCQLGHRPGRGAQGDVSSAAPFPVSSPTVSTCPLFCVLPAPRGKPLPLADSRGRPPALTDSRMNLCGFKVLFRPPQVFTWSWQSHLDIWATSPRWWPLEGRFCLLPAVSPAPEQSSAQWT